MDVRDIGVAIKGVNEDCPICILPLDDEGVALNGCGHQFHFECLENWVNDPDT